MVWWQREPELFISVKEELEAFSFLSYEMENSLLVIRGLWPVKSKTNLMDEYSIKIVLPDDYPISIPKVYELVEIFQELQTVMLIITEARAFSHLLRDGKSGQ